MLRNVDYIEHYEKTLKEKVVSKQQRTQNPNSTPLRAMHEEMQYLI